MKHCWYTGSVNVLVCNQPPRPTQPSITPGPLVDECRVSRWNCEIPWERVSYLRCVHDNALSNPHYLYLYIYKPRKWSLIQLHGLGYCVCCHKCCVSAEFSRSRKSMRICQQLLRKTDLHLIPRARCIRWIFVFIIRAILVEVVPNWLRGTVLFPWHVCLSFSVVFDIGLFWWNAICKRCLKFYCELTGITTTT